VATADLVTPGLVRAHTEEPPDDGDHLFLDPWAAFRVMDALGLETYRALREQRLASIRRIGDLKTFPSLAELGTFPQWLAVRRTQGPEITYFQAFFAVELLIDRHGAQGPIDYFRRYQELLAFDREFAAHLRSLLR
jgi:hypothetical protein